MTLLDNDHFLTELAKLFQKSRMGGPSAISITMKKYDGRSKPRPRSRTDSVSGGTHASSADSKCLFRARLGNAKISTVVNPKEVNKFQLAYANLLKLNIDNLKKRERKPDKEKRKSTASKKAH